MCHANTDQKKAGVLYYYYQSVDFRTRNTARDAMDIS